MAASVVQLAVLASVLAVSVSAYRNCSANKDGATLKCFTCMGRDSDNCMYGEVCCKGSCFKLVDEAHDIIVKGCTSDEEEDGSMKKRTLDVDLYFKNGELISGKSYFCKSGDQCNSGLQLSVVSSVAALLLLFV